VSRAETDAGVALARELFAGLGAVRSRRMFAGAGLWHDGAMFALIANGSIYLRTDEALAHALAGAGSEPFVHESRGRPVTMPYWRLPERALDSPEEAVDWARRALVPAKAAAAARRARATPRPRPRE